MLDRLSVKLMAVLVVLVVLVVLLLVALDVVGKVLLDARDVPAAGAAVGGGAGADVFDENGTAAVLRVAVAVAVRPAGCPDGFA